MIKYQPDKLLAKIAPESKIKKMMTQRVTLKKSAFKFLDDSDVIAKENVVDVALKVIKSYKERIKEDRDVKDEITDDPKLLINRVQNEVVLQISNEIKSQYDGEFYIWLPSDAEEPDPEHQANYGEKFQIGVGEMPGERYGCRCGMEILTEDTKLQL